MADRIKDTDAGKMLKNAINYTVSFNGSALAG